MDAGGAAGAGGAIGAGAGGAAGAAAAGDAGAGAGATRFPTGTYTTCAEGLYDNILNAAGFEDGATLDVAQDGGALTATYVDQSGATSTLGFTLTSSTSATLAGTAQITAGFSVQCVHGPGNVGTYPAVMDATAGALTVAGGTMFLTVTGTVHGDAGSCGPQSAPATFWVVGADGPAAEPSADTTTPPPATALPGVYTCNSQVETRYESDGTKQFVAGGGQGGTLEVAQDGATLTANYAGDTGIAGTLRFDPATETTAIATAAAHQNATTPCEVPIGAGSAPPQTSGTLSVAAASITAVGPTLFLSFAGAMDASSACTGAQKAGSVICHKQ